jgi:hypothetical protein
VSIPHVPDEKEEDEDTNAIKRRSTISPVKEESNVGKNLAMQVLNNSSLLQDSV